MALDLPADGDLNWGDKARAAWNELDAQWASFPHAISVPVVFNGSSWPARSDVVPADTTYTVCVIWIDPTGTASTPTDALVGDLFEQASST